VRLSHWPPSNNSLNRSANRGAFIVNLSVSALCARPVNSGVRRQYYGSIMKLRERYKRLTLWNKVGLWGGIASILALPIGLFSIYPLLTQQSPPNLLRPEDFRLRFAVSGYNISNQDLERAPRVVHCTGKIGTASVQFDLRLLETVVHPSSRGRASPEIWYEADHFIFYNIDSLNQQGVEGQRFQFGLPFALRDFAGDTTRFQAYLFIRGKWYFTGIESFESGSVIVQIGHQAA
jgi:hypothetical protein